MFSKFDREYWSKQIDLKQKTLQQLREEDIKPISLNLPVEEQLSAEDLQTISDQLTTLLSTLSEKKVMRNVPIAIVTNLVTGLVSATFTLISSIYSLRATYLTGTGKFLHITSIVTSLGHLATMVATLCEYWKVGYDLYKAKSTLGFLAGRFMDGLTANAPTDYIVPVISTIVTVVLVGTSLLSATGAKSVITMGNFSRAAKSIRGDAKEMTEWICEELLQLDLKGDQVVYDEIIALAKRSTELVSIPLYKILTNGEQLAELNAFPDKAIKAMSAVMKSGTKAKALLSAKTLLVQNIQTVKERILAVDAVNSSTQRIETIGILFAGKHAVGKSTLIGYMAKKLGQRFGYSDNVYSLNKQSGGFALPYGGQAFAMYDEFMAKHAPEDDLLKDFNLYCSSGPANLESAHLDGKVQPVKFKALFTTCNDKNPKIATHGGLTENAAKAFWSRILRYEVIDEQNQGRMGANLHRREDFSHLKMMKIEASVEAHSQRDAFVETEMTVSEVLDEISKVMAEREIRYLESLQTPAVTAERIQQLKSMIENNFISNSGRDYCVIRIQGPAGTGKSKLAVDISNMFHQHFPHYGVEMVSDLTPIKEPTKNIYIVDDLIYDSEDMKKYFHWINSTHPESVTIFVTNTVLQPVKGWNPLSVPYTNVPTHATLPDGFARRIGLTGTVYYGKVLVSIADGTGLTIDTSPNYVLSIAKESLSSVDVLDRVFKTFNIHLGRVDGIKRVMEKCPYVFQPDVEIIADSLPKLTNTLSQISTVLQAYVSHHENTTFRVGADFSEKACRTTSPKDWIVGEKVDTAEKLYSMCERLSASVKRIDHKATVHVRINGNIDVAFYEGTLYIYAPGVTRSVELDESTGTIKCLGILVPKEDYAAYIVDHRISSKLSLLPECTLREIRNRIELCETSVCKAYAEYTQIYLLERSIQIDAKSLVATWIKNNKILTFCGTLMTLYATYRTGKFLYKKLFQTSTHHANILQSEPDDATQHFQHRLRKAIVSGDLSAQTTIRSEARAYGHGAFEKLNEWEYELRSNSCPGMKEIIASKDYNKLCGYIAGNVENVAHYMLREKANMLSQRDIFSTPTDLDKYILKLMNNYVTLMNDHNGFCYGLCIRENFIITVSHMFNKVGDKLVVSSDGKLYEAVVEYINRPRDLAQVKVISKNWPAAADISSKFLPNKEAVSVIDTWFIRPCPVQPMAYSTLSTYRHKAVDPGTDLTNPNFQLSESYWLTEFRTAHSMKHVIRQGDCGLPLVAYHKNKFYIVGIHNSYQNMTQYAYFSLLDTNDLSKTIVSNSGEVEKWHIRHPTKGYTVTAHPAVISMIDTTTNTVFGNLMQHGLQMLGFSQEARLYSNPKHDKKLYPVPGLEVVKKPSALYYKDGMDASELVVDMKGRPHTLMTQAMKYTTRTPEYGKWNPDIFKHVHQLISLRFRRDYEYEKPLNMKELLNGLEHLGPVVLDTSPGPIFKKVFNINDKKPLFVNKAKPGDVPFYEVAHNQYGDAFKEWFHTYDRSLTGGIPVLVLSKDNAKVELLPIDKVQKGGVRLFNELCVSFNMVLKKYFGRLINSIQGNYHKGPYAMGANSYLTGSFILRKFAEIPDGVVSNTDYSRFDKTIPREMILAFCQTALQHMPEHVQSAFANTLTYVLHTLDGHLYMVSSGNESGSYVTTLLNCFVVEFTTMYTCCEKYYERNGVFPTLNVLEQIYAGFYCGDDATICVRRNYFTLEDRIRVNAMFNMKLTDAKVESNYPSFCSRVIVPDEKDVYVGYPALKEESIITCLMYFSNLDQETLAMNCNVALFEASLHPKPFFDKIEKAVIYLSNKYGLRMKIDWFQYEQYRNHFKMYVKSLENSPFRQSITANASRKRPNKNQKFENNRAFEAIISNSQNYIETYIQNTKMDPISQLNHYVQINNLPSPHYQETSEGPANDPTWKVKCELKGVDSIVRVKVGYGKTKQEAKREAAKEMAAELLVVRASSGTLEGESAQTKAFDQARTKILRTTHEGNVEMPRIYRHYNNCHIVYKGKTYHAPMIGCYTPPETMGATQCMLNQRMKEFVNSAEYKSQHKIYWTLYRHVDPDLVKAMNNVVHDPKEFGTHPEVLFSMAPYDLFLDAFGAFSYIEMKVEQIPMTANSGEIPAEGNGLRSLVKVHMEHAEEEARKSKELLEQPEKYTRLYFSRFADSDGEWKKLDDQKDCVFKMLYCEDMIACESRHFPTDPITLYAEMHTELPLFLDEQGVGMLFKTTKVLPPLVNMKANSMTETVHPDAVRQAALNQSLSTVVNAQNPQPSLVAPTLAAPGETGISNMQVLQAEYLNPIGPPNMMTFGAVVFDIKTLISSQYLDADTEISWTEGLAAGTILAQIPYDPLGTYVNKYIKAWVGLHKRYHGDLMFRLTVLGNPMYSGYLGVAWMPRKQTGSTVPISEFQKYAYEAKGVTLPWSGAYPLKDARRNDFYRTVDDTDMDERPHLVIVPVMTVENPLKDGVKVRLRLASKLATQMDSTDGNPVNDFVVSEPYVPDGESSKYLPEAPGLAGFGLAAFMQGAKIYLDGGRVNKIVDDSTYAHSYSKHHTDVSYCGHLLRPTWKRPMNRGTGTETSATEYPAPNLSQINFTVSNRARSTVRVSGNFTAGGYARLANIAPPVNGPGAFMEEIFANNTSWIKSSLMNDVPLYLYALGVDQHLVCYSSGKLVTDYGTFYFKMYVTYFPSDNVVSIQEFSSPMRFGSGYDALSPFDHNNDIDAIVTQFHNQSALPVGYVGLNISTIPPSAIAIDGWQNPTGTTDFQFIRALESLIRNMGPYNTNTQVVQITGRDTRNLAPVFYARYDPENKQLYTKPYGLSTQFRIMPIDMEYISMSLEIVYKSTQFPITNVDDWTDRASSFFVSSVKYAEPVGIQMDSNAAMAGAMVLGGAMEGMGKGIGGFAQGMFSIKQQERQQKFLREMQQAKQEQELIMQGNMFRQQDVLQQRQFENARFMQGSDQLFQKEMKGLRNTATLFSQ
uniref:Uncharacterized protein n=1 Tax=Canaosa virus TaxID=2976198 RepID=A0A9E8IKP6_9VIRU|nr:hypothetical protein [Canaosa virus]